jgi:hypothetical protein
MEFKPDLFRNAASDSTAKPEDVEVEPSDLFGWLWRKSTREFVVQDDDECASSEA